MCTSRGQPTVIVDVGVKLGVMLAEELGGGETEALCVALRDGVGLAPKLLEPVVDPDADDERDAGGVRLGVLAALRDDVGVVVGLGVLLSDTGGTGHASTDTTRSVTPLSPHAARFVAQLPGVAGNTTLPVASPTVTLDGKLSGVPHFHTLLGPSMHTSPNASVVPCE